MLHISSNTHTQFGSVWIFIMLKHTLDLKFVIDNENENKLWIKKKIQNTLLSDVVLVEFSVLRMHNFTYLYS